MNVTDIDDKIIRGAAATGESIADLTDRYLERFLADADALRMTRPDVLPRATDHIDQIVELIATLLERGHAYRTDDGSIFFRIASWPAYGRLARLDPGADAGRRAGRGRRVRQGRRPRLRAVEGAQARRAIVVDGDRRRPTRLAHRMLGDEHDAPRSVLRHPHRRRSTWSSRITRTRSPRARRPPAEPFVRNWLHCAHLRIERREDGEVDRQHRARGGPVRRRGRRRGSLRYALIVGPLSGAAELTRTSRWPRRARPSSGSTRCVPPSRRIDEDGVDDPGLDAVLGDARTAFGDALDDDLNISAGLAAVFDLVRELNRRIETRSLTSADAARALAALRDLDQVLGVLPDPDVEVPEPDVQQLLDERAAARAGRDCAASDRLRDALAERGIAVEDTRDGQRWRRIAEPARG